MYILQIKAWLNIRTFELLLKSLLLYRKELYEKLNIFFRSAFKNRRVCICVDVLTEFTV